MKKTLCSVISLLLCITLLVSACGSTSNTAEAEQVAIAYCTALARGDGQGVLALVHDDMKTKDMRSYLYNNATSEEYEDYLNERMTQIATDWFGGIDKDPSVQVTDTEPLSGDDLQSTKEYYKDHYDLDVDQAMKVHCNIKANGKEVDSDRTILKIGSAWYVS